MKINILTVNNGVGLERDGKIIADQLKGHFVKVSDMGKNRNLYGKYDINIHCEIVWKQAFRTATKNYLIPNQEWFNLDWLKDLYKFDAILCKTKHAYDIFSKHHDNVKFISFTSPDMWRKSDKSGILHVAGKSMAKGTKTIIESWKPEYPKLLLTQDRNKSVNNNANIDYRYGRINEDAFVDMLNSHQLHLCTSEVEGWGHYIWEAMSTGAAVITTDAPPMNEYIDNLLVKCSHKEPMNLGTKYFIDGKAFQQTVEKALSMNLKELGQKNRQTYEDNDEYFKRAFKDAI